MKIIKYHTNFKGAYIGQWINNELSMHKISKEIFSWYISHYKLTNDGNTNQAIWFKLQKI